VVIFCINKYLYIYIYISNDMLHEGWNTASGVCLKLGCVMDSDLLPALKANVTRAPDFLETEWPLLSGLY